MRSDSAAAPVCRALRRLKALRLDYERLRTIVIELHSERNSEFQTGY